MMQEVTLRHKEGTYEARSVSGKEVAPEPGWDHRFRVGDAVRTVGDGAYDRGEIVEVAEEEKYYRVDFGLGFLSELIEKLWELPSPGLFMRPSRTV